MIGVNIQRWVGLTVDGESRRVRIVRCPDCPNGTQVRVPYRGGDRMAGHVTLGRYAGPATVIAATCPGDVRITSAYGIVRRGSSRTGVVVASIRSVLRFLD